MKKSFLITTAIDYVNSFPHAGHALEKIQADVLARYHRFLGENVFFLTGTDENSLKNVQAAGKEGISTRELVNRNAKKFYDLKEVLDLSLDDFIRTTEVRHIEGAQKLWKACQKDIYKKTYQGLYCVGCEEFYKENELVNGLCPEHKTKPELIKEENYFFKLSKYRNQLKKIIEKDEVKIIPQTRKNEVISFINSGLKDICISRLAERGRGWGIPVPEDSTQVLWTWFDALSNYINALGYAEDSKKFQEWWQKNENKLHVIGKGILRFHGIYWIAILLSARLALPERIFVHGYLTADNQKMSKSLGNVVDPFPLVKKYGTDAVRYYLLREISPTDDGDFTYPKFEEKYNADLAGGIGNLVARVLTVAEKTKLGGIEKIEPEFEKEIKKTHYICKSALDNFKFNESLKAIWDLIGFCDKYIEIKKPWETKEPKVIYNLLVSLAHIAKLLQSFLPETAEKIFDQLGVSPFDKKFLKFRIKKGKLLFPKLNNKFTQLNKI
ncbi:methionine--tRNA ligase [Patescibacteria group bacterium]|nr:methionine--tRNA ligase [Patescibacteria group bacterium]